MMAPPASKRKRHSAFDDFPIEGSIQEETPQAPPTRQLKQPLGDSPAPAVERIERLKPSQMIPDRFQPRRLLPTGIREVYFSGEIDCYQAAARWLALARQDNAHREIINRLLAMGDSFDSHGQIKPVTGSWVEVEDGRYLFLIETGERRFWAACLTAEANGLKEEPLLRVEVVSQPSRQRQVLENRHAETPSAVGQACEIAALILSELNMPATSNIQDEFDYFRSARSQRMPAGLWEQIMPVMQLTRPRMVQLLNILQLPTSLLELADRYRLPERVLREVLALPAEQWEQMILLSIQKQLTSDQVADFSNSESAAEALQSSEISSQSKRKKPPSLIAASGLRRFANTLQRLDEVNQAQALDELANELVVSGDAEGVLGIMEELFTLVRARLERR